MKNIILIGLGALVIAVIGKIDVRSPSGPTPISNPKVKSTIDMYDPSKQCDVFSGGARPQLLGTAYKY